MINTGNVLEVKDLRVYFRTPAGAVEPRGAEPRTIPPAGGTGAWVKAVDGVNFDVQRGEIFGLVGESGSGKTMTALSILKLIWKPGEIVSGNILFNGMDLMRANDELLRSIRGSKISIVFQEPATAFNPVFTVGYQIAESVMVHQGLDGLEAEGSALKFLKKVHIADPERVYHSYPHHLSGGTKQRAMIAMALVNSPELLILDEPTTALDVTIQAQVLDLLKELIDRDRTSALFISHDLGIVAKMCDRVGVMHKGRLVETGSVEKVLGTPEDPYTVSLIESVKALS